MKKNKKVIIIVAVCILLIAATVGGLILFKKKAVAAVPATGSASGTSSGSTGISGTTTTNSGFPLKLGSTGDLVKQLQTKMNEWMAANWNNLVNIKPRYQSGPLAGSVMSSISVDGSFGKNTQEFCGFVFGSTTVTEAQFNTMSDTTSTTTTSSWDDSSVPDKTADQSWWDYWVANIGSYF